MTFPRDLEFREYRHQDAAGFLRLHDSRWRQISPDFWRRWSHQPEVTAAVALSDGEVVGQIPFHIREFLVRPGVTVRVAQEYSVIVDEKMRGRGIGGRLIAEAERFLSGRCEVLTVYRGGERSPGYRFYQRTGHHDLTYYRLWKPGEETALRDGNVVHTGTETLLEREQEVLRVFQSAYAGRAGFPPRAPGYWDRAMGSVIFREAGGNFQLLYVEQDGGLAGYLLCLGRRGGGGGLAALEFATRDGHQETAEVLLRHAAWWAHEHGGEFTIRKSDESAYAPALKRAGFRQVPRSERSMMTMARVFDPGALARRVLAEAGVSLPFEVAVWTPEREATLNPGAGGRQLTLEMKEPDLARLLMCRLDLLQAVMEERITAVGNRPGDLEMVADAFPFTPWDYHQLDYI